MIFEHQNRVPFPALRVRRDGAAVTEFFMANPLEITYKSLPVCDADEGESFAAQIDIEDILDLLGPPTHYFLSSTDPCWLMTAAAFARFKDEEAVNACPAEATDVPVPGAGWFAPLPRIPTLDANLGNPVASARGGGMLTRHIDFSKDEPF